MNVMFAAERKSYAPVADQYSLFCSFCVRRAYVWAQTVYSNVTPEGTYFSLESMTVIYARNFDIHAGLSDGGGARRWGW